MERRVIGVEADRLGKSCSGFVVTAQPPIGHSQVSVSLHKGRIEGHSPLVMLNGFFQWSYAGQDVSQIYQSLRRIGLN